MDNEKEKIIYMSNIKEIERSNREKKLKYLQIEYILNQKSVTTFQIYLQIYNIIPRMFELNNHRKFSIDQSYEIDENNTLSMMFPRTDAFQPEETLDYLKLKFDPQLHYNNLLHSCFRCHKTKLVETYNRFNLQAQLGLQEPSISTFYSNDCFVSLYDLGKFLEGKISKFSAIMMDQIPSNLKKLLDYIFMDQGYIPNFERFLLFYPTYLEKHKALQRQLFEENRIDNKIAYFLGLIACAELGSLYGINRMLNKFSKVGGNLDWVSKRKYPQKIRRLLKLNRKLARSVWEVNSDLIEEILESNQWSKDQLALIIQILTFSHQFATISLAIGLNCEQINNSVINFKTLIQIKQEYDSVQYESHQGQRLASIIQNLGRTSSGSDEQYEKNQKQRKKQLLNQLQAENSKSRKTLKKSLRRSDNEEIVENYMKEINNELNKQEMYFKFHQVIKPLLPDYHVISKRSDKQNPPLDASDTNFKYTAFPLLYNLTNKAAELALDLVNYSEIMTSKNFGKSKIEGTKPFRKAIRYYTQNLCGYFHFQYNYKNIVKYLTMPLKFYIRLLTLSPLHINRQVLRQIRHQEEGSLNLFDLGHVAILVANCKMGLTLTSAMHSFEQ